MNPLENAARFAALVAPLIDRAAISVHNAISKDAVTALRGDHAFHPGALALISCVVAAGPVTGHEYAELTRYQHFGPSDKLLTGLQERGAIVLESEGGFIATPAGAEVARALVTLQGQTNTELFAPVGHLLPELRRMLDVAAQAAAGDPDSVLGPFLGRGWMPEGASDAAHVWNNSVILRMHRSDAHATAWKEAGQTAQEMRVLPAGPERDAIEVRTNELASLPWLGLTADERLSLLAGLGALPGTGSPI